MRKSSVPPPHWGIICGAWGDTICSLPILRDNNIRKVFFFGPSEGVVEFLEAQDFIDRAVHLNPLTVGMTVNDFRGVTASIWRRDKNSPKVIGGVLDLFATGVKLGEVLNCVTDSDTLEHPLKPPTGLKNTPEAEAWADDLLRREGLAERPFVVLCPVSLQSTSLALHWPHWGALLRWLTDHEDVRFLLCGSDPVPYDLSDRPNVVNLLRQTPTAAHMYALSSRAALTVCTINGLSHWCNAQNLRSLVIANKESSELSSYWPRIQQADNLYALTQHDALGLAKLHAARLIDLSAGGAPRNLPERDWWREWAKLDIRRAYQTCPRMPRSDHNSDFGTSREMYPLYQRIGKALGGRRLLEIGARLGHSLIALAADNPDLTGIDWIDNESYEKNSNRYCQENIVHFFARYRPERTLPEMRWWTTLERMPEAEQCPGRWDVIYIDGEHTYEGKLRDLNWALAMQPRVILVDDYYHMPCNREAIRDFSRDIGLPFWEMHTLRGLAVFDLTGGEAVGALERAGLAIQRAAFEAPEERPYAAVACVWNHAELLPYFLKHYTRLGYPRFFLAVYGGKSSPLWEECERLSEGYDVMLIEEFLTNPTGLTDAAVHMRIAAENVPPGQWWSPLDIDEFLEFSAPISEVIRTAGTANCVAGALLDRVSAGGELNPIQSARPLGEQFPWATQMTKNVVGSTQRKLMLVRDMAQIGGGHHAGLGERTHPTATGWVHHFKWSDSVQVRAVTHLHNHADHRENTSRVYQRFLDYYATHKKLDLSLPQMEPTWLGEKGMFQKGSGGIVV